MEKTKNSCWDCRYQDLSDNTFLGRCTWFVETRNEPAKDIPPERVDEGCRFFLQKIQK